MTLERLPEYDTFAIPVEQIYVDQAFNCRDAFSERSIGPLARSIEEHGLQFPVIVAPRPGPIPYRLIAGFRRRAACVGVLKWKTIPASIRYGLSEGQLRVLNFTENLERNDLNVLEEAHAISKLMRNGESVRSIAAAIKREQRWVRVRLRLLQMPKEVQELAVDCRFGETALEVLWQRKTPDSQVKAARSLAEARRKGIKEYHQAAGVQHTFKRRRSKKELQTMAAKMLEAGLDGVGPRALAWAAAAISDDELWQDVQKELVIHALAKGQDVNQQAQSTDEDHPRN